MAIVLMCRSRVLLQKKYIKNKEIKIKFENLKEVVVFIESYIGREGVQKRMQTNLRVFSDLKLSDLKELEKNWGQKKLEEALLEQAVTYFLFLLICINRN